MIGGQPSVSLVRWVTRDFLDLPGLRLTQAQAMRLWNLDGRDCFELLEHLVGTGFLMRCPGGLYARPPHAHMARASLSGVAAAAPSRRLAQGH